MSAKMYVVSGAVVGALLLVALGLGWVIGATSQQPAALIPPSAAAAPGLTQTALLPFVATPVRVSSLQFATSIDATNRPVEPATTFAAGTTQLYVTTLVEGATDRVYRVEWTFPEGSGSLGLTDSATVTQAAFPFAYRICRETADECTGEPLPSGRYSVAFFLDDVLYQEAAATIQP